MKTVIHESDGIIVLVPETMAELAQLNRLSLNSNAVSTYNSKDTPTAYVEIPMTASSRRTNIVSRKKKS